MPRREAYTSVSKTNQIRAAHVKGMSDVVFKGFQCMNSDCTEFLFVRRDELGDDYEITCPTCGTEMGSGFESKFYDYNLMDKRNGSVIETGEFAIPHSAYIAEAQDYKYCIVCNTMKPLHLFDAHGAREQSGRQGECRLCKGVYNSIKNQTRTSDQHRDASQLRRLRMDLAAGEKIDSCKVYDHYDYKCFRCGKDLRTVTSAKERPLDHTLPAYYLWPLTTATATLLCQLHNGQKSGKWPSEYYTHAERKKLAVMTGIPLSVLEGMPFYNPEAIAILKDKAKVENLLTKYSSHIDELIKLRNRILRDTGFDFFKVTTKISMLWVQKADETL